MLQIYNNNTGLQNTVVVQPGSMPMKTIEQKMG
jgi:hypothetical protein